MSHSKPQVLYVAGYGNNEESLFDVLADDFEPSLCRATGNKYVFSKMDEGKRVNHDIPISRAPYMIRLFRAGKFALEGSLRRLRIPVDIVMAEAPFVCRWALRYRALGLARKVIYMESDWLPEDDPALPFHRRLFRKYIHQALDISCAAKADMTWNISERIIRARERRAPFLEGRPTIVKYSPVFKPVKPRIGGREQRIIYVGLPRKGHHLDMLFNVVARINTSSSADLHIDIVGDSPLVKELAVLASNLGISSKITWHGALYDEAAIESVVQRCILGYAIYGNLSDKHYSYYGIPSKVIQYFSYGLPALTTDIAEFCATIRDNGLGYVVNANEDEVERAIRDAIQNHGLFAKNIAGFVERHNRQTTEEFRTRLASLLEQ